MLSVSDKILIVFFRLMAMLNFRPNISFYYFHWRVCKIIQNRYRIPTDLESRLQREKPKPRRKTDSDSNIRSLKVKARTSTLRGYSTLLFLILSQNLRNFISSHVGLHINLLTSLNLITKKLNVINMQLFFLTKYLIILVALHIFVRFLQVLGLTITD